MLFAVFLRGEDSENCRQHPDISSVKPITTPPTSAYDEFMPTCIGGGRDPWTISFASAFCL